MKVKLTVPTELKDIRLSQYQKFLKTTKDIEDVNYIHRQMVAIFCDIPDDAVNLIKAKDYKSIVNTITETLNKKHTLIERFNYKGVEYGFIPNLEEITVGEKADIDAYFEDSKDWGKMMAVCYRPVMAKHKNKYKIEDYDNSKSEPLDLTMDVVIGCMLFFYNLMKDLLNYIPNYTEAHLEAHPKVMQTLEKNGVGINQFTQSLKEITSNLIAYQKNDYIKSYSS